MDGHQEPGLQVGKQCYLRLLNQTYLVEIIGLAEDTIGVTFPSANFPVEGMGAELEIHDREGFLCFHTRVAIGPKELGDGIVLQRAEAATYLKHRRTWRVPVDFKVKLRRSSDGVRGNGRLVDLSSEGALMETQAAFAQGDDLAMKFRLPGRLSSTVQARIIHWREAAGPGYARAGLRFSAVPPDARRALTKFLYARIRVLYRPQLKAMYPKRRSSKRRK